MTVAMLFSFFDRLYFEAIPVRHLFDTIIECLAFKTRQLDIWRYTWPFNGTGRGMLLPRATINHGYFPLIVIIGQRHLLDALKIVTEPCSGSFVLNGQK